MMGLCNVLQTSSPVVLRAPAPCHHGVEDISLSCCMVAVPSCARYSNKLYKGQGKLFANVDMSAADCQTIVDGLLGNQQGILENR